MEDRPEGRLEPDDLYRTRTRTRTPGTHTRPSHVSRTVTKAHIVIEPDTGPITIAELRKASGPANSDGAVGARLLTQDATVTGTGIQVLADSAYGAGDMLAALALTGHTPVIKP
jgi:hypothetical protein